MRFRRLDTNITTCTSGVPNWYISLFVLFFFAAKMTIRNADFDDVTGSAEHSVVDVLDLAVPVGVDVVHPFGRLEGRWWFQSTPQHVHLAAYGEQFHSGFCTDPVHDAKSVHSPSTARAPQTVPGSTPLTAQRRQSTWERYVRNNVRLIYLFFLNLKRFSK